MESPPPPPPHGAQPGQKSSGLPPGNYDIFIIPPHSSGGGFLYLPSLQPNRNSFLAGAACMLVAVMIWQIVFPVLKNWFASIMATGGMGVLMLIIAVGIAGWAWGKTQGEDKIPSPREPPGAGGGATPADPPPSQHAGPPPGANAPPPRPKPTWQRTNPQPGAGTNTGRSNWEKARDETRKREEERKAREKREQEERIAREKKEEEERIAREKKEEEERKAREERAKAREKEAREREAREREAKEREVRETLLRKEKETVKVTNMAPPPPSSPKKDTLKPDSPKKIHRPPSATTYLEADEDQYSYRPYDKPKRSNKQASHSSVYSESSYAPSQSTARTTPPPSHRGPYSTKDPDKIVIKAVYSFNNAFQKKPIAELISGVGHVTDGLILRITTEGLFIDDDVRGVPQREWDVKAWTMKLVEVWCPQFPDANVDSAAASSAFKKTRRSFVAGLGGGANSRSSAEVSGREADALLESLLRVCKSSCPSCSSASVSESASTISSNSRSQKSGDYRGLHVLRASIRDQEGRRYVFVLKEEEGWKVAVGLQRLRRGTQVRALGVSGMSVMETRNLLENLGWM